MSNRKGTTASVLSNDMTTERSDLCHPLLGQNLRKATKTTIDVVAYIVGTYKKHMGGVD